MSGCPNGLTQLHHGGEFFYMSCVQMNSNHWHVKFEWIRLFHSTADLHYVFCMRRVKMWSVKVFSWWGHESRLGALGLFSFCFLLQWAQLASLCCSKSFIVSLRSKHLCSEGPLWLLSSCSQHAGLLKCTTQTVMMTEGLKAHSAGAHEAFYRLSSQSFCFTSSCHIEDFLNSLSDCFARGVEDMRQHVFHLVALKLSSLSAHCSITLTEQLTFFSHLFKNSKLFHFKFY